MHLSTETLWYAPISGPPLHQLQQTQRPVQMNGLDHKPSADQGPASLQHHPPETGPASPPDTRSTDTHPHLGAHEMHRLLHWAWKLSRGILIALVLLSVAVVGALRWFDPPASSFMLRQAMIARQYGSKPPYYHFKWMPLKAMPPDVPLAVIAAEDQRFPIHHGFDMVEIRLAWADFQRGERLRGASTITQQTAKNLFLWPSRSWLRKALETWFGALLELLWSKERILEVYLNIAQFGPGTYGVAAASERYFKHPAQSLTLKEASLMAGVLPAPSNYRLDKPSARLLRRAQWIEDQTRRLGGKRYLKQL